MIVTCAELDGNARLVPGAVVIIEVVSPNSGRIDRIQKVREYAATLSVRRYVILKLTRMGLTVFEPSTAGVAWQATTLSEDDVLHMPEIGMSVPVLDFYDSIEFAQQSKPGNTV